MNIPPSLDFTAIGPSQSMLNNFVGMLQKLWRNLASVVNGNLDLTNLNGVRTSVLFSTANTNVTITHNLNRVPVGYIVLTKSQAGDVFTGSVAATATQITLQCSTGGTTVGLYIL